MEYPRQYISMCSKFQIHTINNFLWCTNISSTKYNLITATTAAAFVQFLLHNLSKIRGINLVTNNWIIAQWNSGFVLIVYFNDKPHRIIRAWIGLNSDFTYFIWRRIHYMIQLLWNILRRISIKKYWALACFACIAYGCLKYSSSINIFAK